VVGKVGLEYSSPFTFAALRTVIAAAGMFVLLLALRRPLRPPRLGHTALIGLLQTTGFAGLAMLALAGAGAGKTSVLTYTMPFWLLLLAWAFLGERLRGLQWLAVVMAFAGLVLVVGPWRMNDLLPSVLAVAAGCSWAGSAVVVKLLQRHEKVDVLSLTTWQMILGGVPLLVIAVIAPDAPTDWTIAFIGSLAYNALLANGVGWLLWVFALRELSAGAAGLGTLAVPVLGVLTAWLQLGERPGAAEAAGMTLIIAALALITVRGVAGGRRRAAPLHAGGGGGGAAAPVMLRCGSRTSRVTSTRGAAQAPAGRRGGRRRRTRRR
jgi:drug/metabolite transporter (DMT)-like permease